MNTTTSPKTPAEILAELEQQLEAKTAEVKGADPETSKKIDTARADLEYLSLVQKFNALGKQDQRYAIIDVTSHGKGFIVVVVSPKAELHRKTVTHLAKNDQLTDAKVIEMAREYVKHPAIEEFDAMLTEAPALLDTIWLAITDLWGARARIRREK